MIYLGADHGGFKLKGQIKNCLSRWGKRYCDLGNDVYDDNDDYPDFALAVAKKVKKGGWGILFCRSAAGMVIAANKMAGIHAAAAFDVKSAKHSREHNDANVLVLSGDWLDQKRACQIVRAWLNTKFAREARHLRRLGKIKALE